MARKGECSSWVMFLTTSPPSGRKKDGTIPRRAKPFELSRNFSATHTSLLSARKRQDTCSPPQQPRMEPSLPLEEPGRHRPRQRCNPLLRLDITIRL
jgi:hypothetical protein